MYSDGYGCFPQWLGWVATGLVLAGLTAATVLTFGAAAPITGVAATMVIGATIGAYVGFGASMVSQAISGEGFNSWLVLLDTGLGGVTGAMGGSGIGTAGSMITGGILGFGGSVAGDVISGQSINWRKAIFMGTIGVGLGAFTGAGASNTKAMNASINAGKSWGSKSFLAVGRDVAMHPNSGLALQAMYSNMAKAILGFTAQSITKVTASILLSCIAGSI